MILKKKTGINDRYIVDVDKKIPDGAGLGGGSSNAAYVLYSINKINRFPLDNSELTEIAENNGSDIPFFLKAVTAVVEGRGEKIYPVDSDLTGYSIVIACPDFRISTREAYKLFDEKGNDNIRFSEFRNDEIGDILVRKPEEWPFFNSFTPLLEKKEKVYRELFNIFAETGSSYHNITGSGSAAYGIYCSDKNAFNAEEKLKNKFPFVWNGKMLAGKPLLDK